MSAPALPRHALPTTTAQSVLRFAELVVFAMGRFLWAVALVLLVVVGGPDPWT